MIINHNLNAMNAHRNMGMNTVNSGKSMEKLSSGLRINRAGDDAAGLAISEKMRGQIRGLDQASRNAQDGISMIQTAEGALNETHSILQRMRELAVQAGNDTNTESDRGEIQKEINQLTSEINRIGNTTEFNNQSLIKGNSDIATKNTTAGVKGEAGVTAIQGKYELDGTLTAGKVTIDGEELTITGGTQDELYKSLEAEIKANTKLDGKYDVTAYTDGDEKLTLTQATGKESSNALKATGVTVAEDTAGVAGKAAITEVAGVDEISGELKAGDITIDGKKLTIVGDTQEELYQSLADEIGKDTDLNTTYTVGHTAGETKLTLTQNTGFEGPKSAKVESGDKSFVMQVGANEKQTMTLEFGDMRSSNLGITGSGNGFTNTATVTNGTNNDNVENALDVSNSANAGNAVTLIQKAIDKVSGERSKLGAYQNRLEHTINNLGTSSENLTAAESRVRDVDMAKEMMNFSKNNILSQAAQAMLAQANQQPQGVLQLLR